MTHKNPKSKCPRCNSTRVNKTTNAFKCMKCGFFNDKTAKIEIHELG